MLAGSRVRRKGLELGGKAGDNGGRVTPQLFDLVLNCWVLAYAPLLERRLRPFRKPHCGSVRVNETYARIRVE